MGKTILVATTDLITSKNVLLKATDKLMFAFTRGNTKLACLIQQTNMNVFTFTTVFGLT